ncbi:MAG: mandelate racemase/muconate lactonizing enzyme family protein [Pseudomonadota bacterium]
MHLQSCEVFVVGNPPPRKGGRYFIFVELETSNGIKGVGEVYVATFGPQVVADMVRDVFARHFEGKDPHNIEDLWRQTYSSGYGARPDASLVGVLSGLEIACWDILGKAADKPIYDLWGGKSREKIRSYTYMYPAEGDVYPDPEANNIYNNPDIAAERALDYLALGFNALKFDPAGPYTAYSPHQPRMEDLERSAEFCKKIREAVGNKADLLFGTHGQFTTSGAKRMARRIEPYEPLWFEEPVAAEMPEQMAEVARSTSVPIATGERLVSKYEFARVLACGAAAILQPALGRVGGLLESRKIAAIAETYYAQMAPHLYAGPVEGAANVQLAATIPNFLILESIERWDGFHGEIVKGVTWQDGYVIPSKEPGLGIEFDADLARATPYTDTELHLEMQPNEVVP